MKPGFEALMRRIADRIRSVFSRGLVTAVEPADEVTLQRIQVGIGGDLHDRIAHAQPYGLAAVPPLGAEAHVLFPGASREEGIALIVDDRRGRPALEPGEVALYHPGAGTEIRMRQTGEIVITGDVRVTGSILAEGDVSDGEGRLGALRTAYDSHIHTTPQGPSGPPQPTSGGGA